MVSQVKFNVSTPGETGNSAAGVVVMALDAGGTPHAASQANPVPVVDAFQAPVASNWTSATPLNTSFTMATGGMDQVVVTIVPPAGLTGGVVGFQVYDGATWIPVKAARTDSYQTDSSFSLSGSPGTHA